MKLGKLTDSGLNIFAEYLAQARLGEVMSPPVHLLSDPESSVIFADSVDVDAERSFASRFACAEYLNGVLDGLPAGADRDVGMWAWLSLLYFDQVCPAGKDGERKVGEQARYIPVPNSFRRFYRHLLLGPYLIYRAHQSNAAVASALLVNPVSAPGDIVEQLMSRQELVSNAAVMGVATRLYVDDGGSIKRGAGSKGAGTARRLVDICNQFDLTYDLYAMSSDDLLAMLPKEFGRFVRAK